MSVISVRQCPQRSVYLLFSIIVITVVALAAIGAGCGSGDLPLWEADPEAVPEVTEWEQVNAIVQRECTPCHGENGEEPRYDRCEDVVGNFEDLYDQVFEQNLMPPGAWPRLSSEEKLVLSRWSGEAPCR